MFGPPPGDGGGLSGAFLSWDPIPDNHINLTRRSFFFFRSFSPTSSPGASPLSPALTRSPIKTKPQQLLQQQQTKKGADFELELKTVARFAASLSLGYRKLGAASSSSSDAGAASPSGRSGGPAHGPRGAGYTRRAPTASELRALAAVTRPAGPGTVFRTVAKLSLQAMGPYEAVAAEARAEKTRHKLSLAGPRDFDPTIKVAGKVGGAAVGIGLPVGPSILIAEPYAQQRSAHQKSARGAGEGPPFRTGAGGTGGRAPGLLEDYHLKAFHQGASPSFQASLRREREKADARAAAAAAGRDNSPEALVEALV